MNQLNSKMLEDALLAPVVGVVVPGLVAFIIGSLVYVAMFLLVRKRGGREMTHLGALMLAFPIGAWIFLSLQKVPTPGVLLLPGVLGAAVLVLAWFRASIKGAAGESSIRKLLANKGYTALHDIRIPSKGGVTQIDHVVLISGVIVAIEVKNYGGAIYGRPEDARWKQVFAGGRQKNDFQNPLRQNHGHVAALVEIVGQGVGGLVVFVGDAIFPKGMPDGVVSPDDLVDALRSVASRIPPLANASAAWSRLEDTAARGQSSASKRIHKVTVRAAKARNDKVVSLGSYRGDRGKSRR